MTLTQRLDALKDAGVIAGYEAPHRNQGRLGAMLPWVVMPAIPGPAATYYNDRDLDVAIRHMEVFGARTAYMHASVDANTRQLGYVG